MNRILVFIALIGVFAFPVFGQKEKSLAVDSDGEFHTGSQIRFGDQTLKPGMYRISQIAINSEHFIVIREVRMNQYGKGMGPLVPGAEAARLKCAELTVNGQNRKSEILVRLSAAGERTAAEVRFRGENVKHILPLRLGNYQK